LEVITRFAFARSVRKSCEDLDTGLTGVILRARAVAVTP
jgi:hypothetical protein